MFQPVFGNYSGCLISCYLINGIFLAYVIYNSRHLLEQFTSCSYLVKLKTFLRMVSVALILLLVAVGANGWFTKPKPKGEIHL